MLGATLLRAGGTWLCARCLAQCQGSGDLSTKATKVSLAADRNRALSRRAKVAGDIEDAAFHASSAAHYRHQHLELQNLGDHMASQAVVVHGEVAAGPLKETLTDPGLIAVESSHARGQMLVENDVVALAIDVSNAAGAANTHEKLIAHQVALAHKIAMEQARLASYEMDASLAVKRLNLSARMMTTAQEGMLNLQKLRSSGPQKVVVQHVTVEAGGQAVVGAVEVDRRGNDQNVGRKA